MTNLVKLMVLSAALSNSQAYSQIPVNGQFQLDQEGSIETFEEAGEFWRELANTRCEKEGYSLVYSGVNIRTPSGDFVGIFSCRGSEVSEVSFSAYGFISTMGSYLYVSQKGDPIYKPIK